MAVRLISASPVESEAYTTTPVMGEAIESVGQMIMDLHDEEIDQEILLVLNDPDTPEEFTLAFGGSTLSLEFRPEVIEVVDFNEGDEVVLEKFPRDSVNAATTWLVNKIKE